VSGYSQLVGNATRAAVVILVALLAAGPANAKGFSGDVCALLTAKQATSTGAAAACKSAAALPAPGGTQYGGNWAGATTKAPALQVTVVSYTDPTALALAKRNLKEGLNGPPKAVKIKGLGTVYEATSALASGLHFTIGKDVVYLSLTSIAKKPNPPSSLEPLAQVIAGEL
jgi:hypothetical protein